MSKSICSVPLEGCFSYDCCDALPSSGRHDNWMKVRLCWTVTDDVCEAVSHYVVWTSCPDDSVRTLSAVDDSKATSFDESVAVAASTSERTVSSAAEMLHDGDTVDPHVNDGGPPAKISRQDQPLVDTDCASASEAAVSDAVQIGPSDAAVPPDDDGGKLSFSDTREHKTANSGRPVETSREDQSCTDAKVWRCLGLTPVPSLSIQSKNLLDHRGNFRVQPILFTGTVLPHVSVIVK